MLSRRQSRQAPSCDGKPALAAFSDLSSSMTWRAKQSRRRTSWTTLERQTEETLRASIEMKHKFTKLESRVSEESTASTVCSDSAASITISLEELNSFKSEFNDLEQRVRDQANMFSQVDELIEERAQLRAQELLLEKQNQERKRKPKFLQKLFKDDSAMSPSSFRRSNSSLRASKALLLQQDEVEFHRFSKTELVSTVVEIQKHVVVQDIQLHETKHLLTHALSELQDAQSTADEAVTLASFLDHQLDLPTPRSPSPSPTSAA